MGDGDSAGAPVVNGSSSSSSAAATTSRAEESPPRGGSTSDLVLPDQLYVLVPLTEDDPLAASLLTACESGDRDGCTQLLDLLAQDCLDGDLAACDGLYWVTLVGSSLEEFGATCGHRVPDTSSAGRCSEE